jgi:hypothetical protein
MTKTMISLPAQQVTITSFPRFDVDSLMHKVVGDHQDSLKKTDTGVLIVPKE